MEEQLRQLIASLQAMYEEVLSDRAEPEYQSNPTSDSLLLAVGRIKDLAVAREQKRISAILNSILMETK